MRSLYEKLNRLDDSLVKSKTIVKKKKLTEGYSNEMTEFMNWIQEYKNGALWDAFTTEFESEQDPNIDVVLDWLEVFDETAYYDYVAADTYDDDIDEMLTEGDSAREKLMNTYPDDFGHWELYDRTPETKKVDISKTTSSKELSARQKLLKAFPDLQIGAYEPLKEAIKDTDYVIVLTHPNMPQDKRYSYFGSNYRMTRDLNKAMTYPGKFSAKDEIKYALDATDGHWDPSYAERFSVMTIAQVKELLNTPKPEKVSRAVHHNPSAQEAAKPIAKEIHEVIKKHNVSLSSFLKLITEIVKSEDPNA